MSQNISRKQKGISVEERQIAISEIMEAHQNGTLQEAFGLGTAVTVIPINPITYREEKIYYIIEQLQRDIPAFISIVFIAKLMQIFL